MLRFSAGSPVIVVFVNAKGIPLSPEKNEKKDNMCLSVCGMGENMSEFSSVFAKEEIS